MEMKIKMDKTVLIVSAVVGSLGLLSAILGFAAEGSYLIPSPGLGVCAAIFLLAAQITVSVAVGYYRSRAIPSETKRVVGIVCAVVSWVVAVIAFALLLRGATMNALGYIQDGLFAGAAVLTLAATALGITSFIMLRRQPEDAAPAANKPSEQQQAEGIPAGHPPTVQPEKHEQSPSPFSDKGDVGAAHRGDAV
ncbi:uncharacterized protein LOC133884448 [Phragmites australis]|uniref:uncharacterized protein LOC133884448 n=1 Tax=Phragmites australis TaxID=29695 RepID=UPI002D788825|nr:uncharacterized protein LOC133884448 [Phragmites australis]